MYHKIQSKSNDNLKCIFPSMPKFSVTNMFIPWCHCYKENLKKIFFLRTYPIDFYQLYILPTIPFIIANLLFNNFTKVSIVTFNKNELIIWNWYIWYIMKFFFQYILKCSLRNTFIPWWQCYNVTLNKICFCRHVQNKTNKLEISQ